MKTRNRKNRKDISISIKEQIALLGLSDTELNKINAIIDNEMATGGKTASKAPMTNEVGEVLYWCSRSEQYLPIEDMVTNTDGSSRGYSKKSQEILTEVNREIKELTKESQTALLAGDIETAIELSNKIKVINESKKNLSIYKA